MSEGTDTALRAWVESIRQDKSSPLSEDDDDGE